MRDRMSVSNLQCKDGVLRMSFMFKSEGMSIGYEGLGMSMHIGERDGLVEKGSLSFPSLV